MSSSISALLYWVKHICTFTILPKMYFCMPPNFWPPFYTTSTQHTDFLFGPNLVSPKSLNNKFQIFPFTPYPLGAQNKFFFSSSSIQHIDRCTDANDHIYTSPSNPKHPYPQNSAIMTRNDDKWRISIQYLNV